MKRGLLFITLIVIIFSNLLNSLSCARAEEQYSRHFSWSYGGTNWTWDMTIPKSLYDTYKSIPLSARTVNDPAGYSYLITTRDSYVVTLANELREVANREGYGTFDEVSLMLAFVQSLPYTSDSVTTGHDEYPRFPIETLVDRGGDCEDTSILFATLALILNYGVIFIIPPKHFAVGILGGENQGSYYNYNGGKYFYCETTGKNFRIGDIPKEYNGISVSLFSINQNEQYILGQYPYLRLLIWPAIFAVAGMLLYGYAHKKRKASYASNLITQTNSPVQKVGSLRRYCINCGAVIPPNANYCTSCGQIKK